MTDAAAQGPAQDEPHFEERAENLSEEQFDQWTTVTKFEERVLSQLCNSSPRLLVGPRGCGKTTLLRLASQRIARTGRHLPIYVNYQRSFNLEPAFSTRADAAEFFQEWLTAKILAAARTAHPKALAGQLASLASGAQSFIDRAERDPSTPLIGLPGPAALSKTLSDWAIERSKAGVILLLDDAAQAFAPEQQRIFFEYVQNIRSSLVSYKAAIYPGVTEYSPTYNIGHDAKIVDAWAVNDDRYVASMHSLLERRMPDGLPPGLSNEVVELLAAASFGIPRGFLNMIETFLGESPDPGLTTSVAVTTINQHAEEVDQVFRQLAKKVPAFGNYISAGVDVEQRMCNQLRLLNTVREERSSDEQAVDIAIRVPVNQKLRQILGLLEYAGIVRVSHETVSYGDHVYLRVALHSAILMSRRAFAHGQNPTLRMRARAALRGSRQFSSKRVLGDRLLPPVDAAACVLKLGECARCHQPRPTAEARFCFNCGAELKDESRYAQLVQASIAELALPSLKLEVLQSAGFSTVEDILNDRGQTGLLRLWSIGPTWARRIQSRAAEYVSL